MYPALRSYGFLRQIDQKARTVEAVISTGNIARDQMIIDPDGWDFRNYMRNPVVLWGHDDGAMPVARTIGEPKRTTTEILATAEFDADDPEADRLLGKIARGYVNATSVRWLPKRTEMRSLQTEKGERDVLVFVEQELLEWSFVSIPTDPGAMIMRADGAAVDLSAFGSPAPPPMPDPIARLNELLTTDLDPETIAKLKDLHQRLTPVVTDRPVVTRPTADRAWVADLERVTTAIEALTSREPLDAEAMVIAAVARHTGKTEERVRAELAGGSA